MSSANVLFDAPGPKALRLYRAIAVVTVAAILAFLATVLWLLISNGQLSYDKWEVFVTPLYLKLLAEAALTTLAIAAVAILAAVAMGLLLAVGKMSDHAWLRWPAWLVVEFFRAVPLLLLIIFLWAIFGYPRSDYRALVIGLTLYNGSVLAEIFRAGVKSLPKGQSEAAYALGMRKTQVMSSILLPQAVKVMFPSIISQCIVALKDTSLGYAVLAPGLTLFGQRIWNSFDNRLVTLLVLAGIYIALNLLVTWIGGLVQRRVVEGKRVKSATVDSQASADEPV